MLSVSGLVTDMFSAAISLSVFVAFVAQDVSNNTIITTLSSFLYLVFFIIPSPLLFCDVIIIYQFYNRLTAMCFFAEKPMILFVLHPFFKERIVFERLWIRHFSAGDKILDLSFFAV